MPTNLFANGDFETDTVGWGGNSNTLSRETGAPLAGTGSLKVLFTGTGGWTTASGACVIGHTYKLTARVKSTAAAGRLTRWIIYNGATATGASVDCSAESTITLTFVATGTSVQPRIERAGGGVANEYLIIDSATFYESVTNIQTVNGLAKASVATKNGLALASIKSINGLA